MTKLVIPAIFSAVDRISGPMQRMQSKMESFSKSAMNISRKSAVVGLAILAPMGAMANAAIKFEDRMADVGKTTGLSGVELQTFGDALLKMSKKTRTSIDDLAKIGEIGGQLGVAKGELVAFVEASDKFNIALGADFGGVDAAISQVGKLKSLFKETRSLAIADTITKAGSAINELGAIGAGTSANITDFMLRIGALPDAIKPSITSTAALGTFFEEVGIDAQIASGGISNLFLVAGKNISKFATQMKLPAAAAKELFATDPTAFAVKFAKSLNKLAPDQLASKLQELGVGSQETIKTIGALGSGYERLAELQKVSADAFGAGTSLAAEAAKKNATMAAKLEIARNNFQALSITLGTKLLPIISKMMDKVMPIIEAVATWVEQNPQLATTILVVAGAVGTLAMAISGISFVVAAFSGPIGLIVLAVAALVALVGVVVTKWNDWGAALTLFLGPLGLIISVVQSFRRNWDMVARAFKTDGILGGIKAIGKTLLDAILMPLQQILEIASGLPGKMGAWAAAGAASIERFRRKLGVDMTEEDQHKRVQEWEERDTPFPARINPKANDRAANEEAMVRMMQVMHKQQAEITIKDQTGKAEVSKNTGGIPIRLTPTLGW